EHTSRRIDVARMDYSASLVPGAVFEDLDPVEFARVRDLIGRLGGDAVLTELGDVDLAKALRAVETRGDVLAPNVAGLLLLGREDALQRLLPGHEIRFQVLSSDGSVVLNEVYRGPIGKVLEQVGTQFAARNQEAEISIGLLRLPIPDYSPEGFREALNNAVLHRDYSRLGAVYIQLQPDGLFIANPGGFPRGVTVDNLLVHEPNPRNPRLAEVFRRVGLVEQTGRGVDRIYLGQLRYGRPLPDYSQTDADGVRVVLRGGDGSLEFTQVVFEESQDGQLSLDQLIALNALFHERRSDVFAVASVMQKSHAAARSVLEGLVERGLVEARGSRRAREYMLSAALYRRLHIESDYVRGRGFDRIQHEQMVLTYVREHGRIARSQVADLCGMTSSQAKRLLSRMVEDGALELRGEKRTSHYVIPA
ncbi:MAG: ATP-binding protein, partial [Actinomycetota bacterium]|nr:ATP-binding protein [Actinomycetota bacterium]